MAKKNRSVNYSRTVNDSTGDSTLTQTEAAFNAMAGSPEQQANGTAAESNGTSNGTAVSSEVARKRAKAPRSAFYQIQGTTRDGNSIDVLGQYPTRNQAEKARDAMGLVLTRNYGAVRIIQCRDKTAV